jgi:Tfp pilus assembly protein PilO
MPASINSLTSVQRQTLSFLIGTIVLLGAAGWLMYDLYVKRADTLAQRQALERKERDAQHIRLPSAEEQAQWAQEVQHFQDILLTDQAVPEFYSEITRIAGENRLDQRFGMTTEEKKTDVKPTPETEKLAALGIKRYLVMTLKFSGEYPDIARFLSALSQLSRPIEYQQIDMKREVNLVDVTLVMHVYKREDV